MEIKFYRCDTCGNVITFLHASGMKVMCCGKPMREMESNKEDAAEEKHVPCVCIDGYKVRVEVGEEPHPMTPEHYIKWILIETENGSQLKELKPGCKPMATFSLCDGDKFKSAYAFCNIHGLWQSTKEGCSKC